MPTLENDSLFDTMSDCEGHPVSGGYPSTED